jgi:uncharacterized membrane protein HdeD (DUF308 family)
MAAPVQASKTLGPPVAAGHPTGAVLAQEWWAFAIRGLLCILFGAAAVLPVVTTRSLIYVFAAYSVLDGVFAMASASRAARSHRHWELRALEGASGILAGAFICLFPGIAVTALVLLIGAWAVVSGFLMYRGAFALHTDHGRYWLVLGGVASMVFGGMLVVSPFIGALVPPFAIGAYALIVGAALLTLGFMLRARTANQLTSPRDAPPTLGSRRRSGRARSTLDGGTAAR